jgi:DNA-binding NtrC family response regulator
MSDGLRESDLTGRGTAEIVQKPPEELEREMRRLRARPAAPLPGLAGNSPALQGLRREVERLACSDRPVLIIGPTRAGKELVARAIHSLSDRGGEPLLELDCAALPPSLIGVQLFGRAGQGRRLHTGLLAAVGRGTLFLDDLGKAPAGVQSRLREVLETASFRALGGAAREPFRGRLVATAYSDPSRRPLPVELHHCLQVLELAIPPFDRVPSLTITRGGPPRLLSEAARIVLRLDEGHRLASGEDDAVIDPPRLPGRLC